MFLIEFIESILSGGSLIKKGFVLVLENLKNPGILFSYFQGLARTGKSWKKTTGPGKF